jgi:hypothetical protein
MKKIVVSIIFLCLSVFHIFGQNTNLNKGAVSYITSQNIYIKFNSTEGINEGDTLYLNPDGADQAALIVTNTSSISAVCKPIGNFTFEKGQEVFFKSKKTDKSIEATLNETNTVAETVAIVSSPTSSPVPPPPENKDLSEISGKISLSSYSNFSSKTSLNQRMRYTFALNANHISNSSFSFESYVSFNHSNQNWDLIKANIFNGLKIYNLAIKYETKKDLNIYFGRKINPNLSNLGAIDGVQVEKKFNGFTLGAFAGSRPNYSDYSYNFDLFQAGLFAGHELKNRMGGLMRNNIAIVEQQNNWNTDRRFIYFQHYQTLIKDVSIFGSAEMDLYKKINGVSQNSFQLTNLYLMIRYRILRNLSVSASYSNRNNIIYYETYKSFIDRLIEQTSLQGFRFSVNYRPINKLSFGARASYRSRKTDLKPSINLNAYLNYLSIPFINTSATVSATYLETSYLKGTIYSLNLNKDLVKRKLYGSLNYRYVIYNYSFSDMITHQHIPEIQLNWRILKDLRASLAVEAIFEDDYQYQRVYINLSKRF